jgi:drug/metabolite transporter (DMT)-like permease
MLVGLIFLVLTAITWVVLGAVISNAAQRGLNLGFIQGAGAIVFALMVLPLYFFTDMTVPYQVLIASFLAGIGNYTTFLLMNKAMQKGPNGLVWAMIQSAFIVPFLMGVIFFNVPCPMTRIIGLVMLVAAMVLMGVFGKNDDSKDEKRSYIWIVFTILGFIVAGATQSCANIPSYLIKEESGGLLTALFRAGVCSGGIFATFFVHGLVNKKIFEWKGCIGSTVVMTLATVLALIFVFVGLDRLAAHNAGAIAYPMIVGISIAIFMVYTAIRLKEKLSLPALLGVLLCLAGIVVIAI